MAFRFLKKIDASQIVVDVIEEAEEEFSYFKKLIEQLLISTKNDHLLGYETAVMSILTVFAIILSLRLLSYTRVESLRGKHKVDMYYLNESNLVKEVFLAYLNAALLDPILSLAELAKSDNGADSYDLFVGVCEFAAICWWIWLVTECFDFTDVMQQYKYRTELRVEADEAKDPKKYDWLIVKDAAQRSKERKQRLAGTVKFDISLWFLLASVGAAFLPGHVQHSDVLHAYGVIIMWIIMHHYCRKATSWGSSYFVSLLFPSVTLLPLQYCLPLMDVADTVEDLEFLVNYRKWVQEMTGAELIIMS